MSESTEEMRCACCWQRSRTVQRFVEGHGSGTCYDARSYTGWIVMIAVARDYFPPASGTTLAFPCVRAKSNLRIETIKWRYPTSSRAWRDLDALLPLPPAAYDACEKQAGRVSSLSLVRYRTNGYPMPVAYGHRDVLMRGYVDQVVISCGSEVIARHKRSYEWDDFVFDPIHYLPFLEQKTGALDQATPLQGWDLPEEFAALRPLL